MQNINKIEDIIQNHSLYFGLDNLEIYLNKQDILFLDQLVYEIDNDNSTSANIQLGNTNFHYSKKNISGYEASFKFDFIQDNQIIDGFLISFVKDTKKVKDKCVLVVYSQLLTLHENNNLNFCLLNFLKTNFFLKKFPKYRRLDFCLDLNIDKGNIIKHFKSFKSMIGKNKTGFYDTYYTREITNEKNQRLLTRIYDKKLDTFKKQKGFLYNHLDYENVNRIEIEIRPAYCKGLKYSIDDLLNDFIIKKNIFFKFLNLDLKDTSQIPCDYINFKLIKDNKYDLSLNFQKLGYIPKSYLQNANGYLKNIIHQTGFDGFLQTVLGVYFDDERTIIRGPNGKLIYIADRKPDILLDELVKYFVEKLHFPQNKINKILKPYIKPAILKLNK